MKHSYLKSVLTWMIAAVWLVNGLYCKLLNQVPRHQEIVGEILGPDYASILTKMIGLSEILMAVWVLSNLFRRLNAVAQIAIVAVMNIIEFIVVPDLLLWGHWNSFFALLFILLIYFWEFVLDDGKEIT